MNIKTRMDNSLVIELVGRLDMNTSESTGKDILAELTGIELLELDLSALDYISSAGLRIILSIQKYLQTQNGKLTLTHPKDDVMEVFEITGFTDILNIVRDKK